MAGNERTGRFLRPEERLPLDLAAAQRRYRENLAVSYSSGTITCQGQCDPPKTEGVKLEPSRTQYHWDGKGENPNKPVWLCRDCAAEHHAHWDDMWEEYRTGVM